MTIATEVRWFWPGELDRAIEDWFRSAEELLDVPIPDKVVDKRTDYYLVGPKSSQYGLKLREEKLELKRMLESSFFRAPRTGVAGIAQIWTKGKWKYVVIETEKSKDAVLEAFLGGKDAKDIAAVQKRRWQRKYVPVEGGKMKRELDLDAKLAHACNVELTALEFPAERHWWTIAFEAYGDIEHPGTLSDTVDWFFERFRWPKPTAERSESYPAWIARLRAAGS